MMPYVPPPSIVRHGTANDPPPFIARHGALYFTVPSIAVGGQINDEVLLVFRVMSDRSDLIRFVWVRIENFSLVSWFLLEHFLSVFLGVWKSPKPNSQFSHSFWCKITVFSKF